MALPEKNIETTIVASRFDDNGRSQVQNALLFGQNMATLDNNSVTFIFGQIIEAINSLENTENDICKDCEVYRPCYDLQNGQFLDLYESIGYLIARGDDEEHFLNYGFCKQNSKILYSYHKRRIRAILAVLFLTGTGCSVKVKVYRQLFQMFIISCLLPPIEAKK